MLLNISVHRMAAGRARLQVRALGARRIAHLVVMRMRLAI